MQELKADPAECLPEGNDVVARLMERLRAEGFTTDTDPA